MSTSIRKAANMMFLQLLPSRANVGNKTFRRNVMHYLCETFDCTVAAAATHYNHAFQRIKEGEPELVVGLGRPEGKNNGGRKRKVAPTVPLFFQPTDVLCLGYTPTPIDLAVLLQAPLLPLLPEVEVAAKLYTVRRCKDGVVAAKGLTEAAAKELIAKAVSGKKAKLEM